MTLVQFTLLAEWIIGKQFSLILGGQHTDLITIHGPEPTINDRVPRWRMPIAEGVVGAESGVGARWPLGLRYVHAFTPMWVHRYWRIDPGAFRSPGHWANTMEVPLRLRMGKAPAGEVKQGASPVTRHPPFLPLHSSVGLPYFGPTKPKTMFRSAKMLALPVALLACASASAQVQMGVKVGANYVTTSMEIKPDPKVSPTNPKGLGMLFGTYAEISFSDMVGLRPELQFNFQRLKSEYDETFNDVQIQTQQGVFTGKVRQLVEDDQRLQYAQVVTPLMITPNENLRIMVGPSFGFLMGGRRDTETTENYDGTIGQTQVKEDFFETEKKKGSAAIRNWRKMEICAMAGIGYTLDVGLDLDLRYYRGIVTKYDESAGTSRFQLWSNTVEFAMGWTFGK